MKVEFIHSFILVRVHCNWSNVVLQTIKFIEWRLFHYSKYFLSFSSIFFSFKPSCLTSNMSNSRKFMVSILVVFSYIKFPVWYYCTNYICKTTIEITKSKWKNKWLTRFLEYWDSTITFLFASHDAKSS